LNYSGNSLDPILCYINEPEKDSGFCWYFDPQIRVWSKVIDEVWIVTETDEMMVPFFVLLKLFEIAEIHGWQPENGIPRHHYKYESSLTIDDNQIRKKGYFITEIFCEVFFEPDNVMVEDTLELVRIFRSFAETIDDSTAESSFIKVPDKISQAEVMDLYSMEPALFFSGENHDFILDFIQLVEGNEFRIEKNRIFERYFDSGIHPE
jgi:hypothetical protein